MAQRYEYKATVSPDLEDLFRSVNGWEGDGWTLFSFAQAYDQGKREMTYTAFLRRSV